MKVLPFFYACALPYLQSGSLCLAAYYSSKEYFSFI